MWVQMEITGLASLSREDVQCPPPGPFSSKDLVWVADDPSRKGAFARIPRDRLEDFRQGEADRCSTSFYVRDSRKPEAVPPKRITRTSLISYTKYWCYYGPDGKAGVDVEQTDQQSKRRRKRSKGEGICGGCSAHFSARVYLQSPESVEIHMVEVRGPCYTSCNGS